MVFHQEGKSLAEAPKLDHSWNAMPDEGSELSVSLDGRRNEGTPRRRQAERLDSDGRTHKDPIGNLADLFTVGSVEHEFLHDTGIAVDLLA